MFWLGIWIFCASKIAFSAKSNRSIITLQKPNALLLLVLLLYCAFIQKLKTSTNHARSWAAKSGSLRSSALPNTHSFNAWGRSSWFFFFFASDKFHLIFFIIYIFFTLSPLTVSTSKQCFIYFTLRWSDFRNVANSRWDHKDAPACLPGCLQIPPTAHSHQMLLNPLCMWRICFWSWSETCATLRGILDYFPASRKSTRLHSYSGQHAVFGHTGMILLEGPRFVFVLAGETLHRMSLLFPPAVYISVFICFVFVFILHY